MFYDEERNAYIDTDTGDIIPLEQGDDFRGISLTEYNVTREANLVDLPQSYVFSDHDSRSQRNGYMQSSSSKSIFDDWSLARALQAAEFEMAHEVLDTLPYENEDGDGVDIEDFRNKEVRASRCKRQLLTVSTLILVIQIGALVAMIQTDGFVSQKENPMIGPSATTLVRYGAKQDGLIIIKKEWWRLITPIFLHAGIIHLVSNGIIQLRVGGYLNQVFGTSRWLAIYFISGIFGNIMSCVFLPNDVGVGSSGALLGMLCSWIVWIIVRWNKIPEQCRNQRNCQLVVVLVSVIVTLSMSFSSYVDWSAHFGGSFQGLLWGIILLGNELDNLKKYVLPIRICAFVISLVSFVIGLYYMIAVVHPSTVDFPIFDQNDDWGR